MFWLMCLIAASNFIVGFTLPHLIFLFTEKRERTRDGYTDLSPEYIPEYVAVVARIQAARMYEENCAVIGIEPIPGISGDKSAEEELARYTRGTGKRGRGKRNRPKIEEVIRYTTPINPC